MPEGEQHFHVRLNRNVSCSLEVRYGYAYRISAFEKPSEQEIMEMFEQEETKRFESKRAQWAELVARLLMEGSGAAPVIPAARTDTLWSEKKERWCESRTNETGSAAHPGSQVSHVLAAACDSRGA